MRNEIVYSAENPLFTRPVLAVRYEWSTALLNRLGRKYLFDGGKWDDESRKCNAADEFCAMQQRDSPVAALPRAISHTNVVRHDWLSKVVGICCNNSPMIDSRLAGPVEGDVEPRHVDNLCCKNTNNVSG